MKSKETSKEITLEFDLSGFDKKDIKLHLSKNSVSISAVKKEDHKEKKKGFFQEEKSFRSFNYSAPLPKIIPKESKISFEKGILKIIAKKE
ncbi:MAG TPA: Hsp20 family protein [Patescibacteria group bacterium]|nr:Hsp20 family protein [Patescibacteria group bacterium]